MLCDDKYYPVQYWGAFNCSDPLPTHIWYAGAYAAHLCMQEEIWDAPNGHLAYAFVLAILVEKELDVLGKGEEAREAAR